MPNIRISEQESTSIKAFDVTENTVLVPILYARTLAVSETGRTYVESDDIPAKLYTSATAFSAAFDSHCVYTSYVEDKSLLTKDKTQAFIYDLLLSGLNVVVKPIIFDNALDKYHQYAKLDVNINVISEEDALDLLAQAFEDGALEEFRDRNLFNIKFITSGAYPNKGRTSSEEDAKVLTMDKVMVDVAEERGDAIALVELRESFTDKTELLEELSAMAADTGYMFASCFFPWCTMTTSAGRQTMPACFAYLKAYASSVKQNANWFAASGVNRGQIPDLVAPTFEVGESLMHILQGDIAMDNSSYLDIRVNPVYNAGTYGYRIWGNRTAWGSSSSNELKYQEFLNVRVLLCDIKKQTFHAAMRTTFEPNDDIVWINFKGLVNTLLERMVSGRGLQFYRWTKEKANDKATIKATLTIKPIEAVESFDINVILTEDETTLTEATV